MSVCSGSSDSFNSEVSSRHLYGLDFARCTNRVHGGVDEQLLKVGHRWQILVLGEIGQFGLALGPWRFHNSHRDVHSLQARSQSEDRLA